MPGQNEVMRNIEQYMASTYPDHTTRERAAFLSGLRAGLAMALISRTAALFVMEQIKRDLVATTPLTIDFMFMVERLQVEAILGVPPEKLLRALDRN